MQEFIQEKLEKILPLNERVFDRNISKIEEFIAVIVSLGYSVGHDNIVPNKKCVAAN